MEGLYSTRAQFALQIQILKILAAVLTRTLPGDLGSRVSAHRTREPQGGDEGWESGLIRILRGGLKAMSLRRVRPTAMEH